MPPRRERAKPQQPKDLCVILVEPDPALGGGVGEGWMKLVRQCVIDKIYAENADHVAICRTDSYSSVQFGEVNWDLLRKAEKKLKEGRGQGKKVDCVRAMSDLLEMMNAQESEDSYELKKMLFFGDLKDQELKKSKAEAFAKAIKSSKVDLSIILANEESMDDAQKANSEILKEALNKEEFEELVYICSENDATKQICNTFSKPPKRSMPWNVELEIGEDLHINLSGLICTRKNNRSELKKAFIKEEKYIPTPAPVAAPSPSTSTTVAVPDERGSGNSKTVMVELATKTVQKEVAWKEKDGTVVPDDDVGKAYYYGDKLIPFNELEIEDTYKSGEKCLKVLVFSPRENIFPAFQLGDGTQLFYAKKNDSASEMKLQALIKALDTTSRIAVVRKVYRKDTRVNLGILSPDVDKQCLVYSEICFADDVSVPHFPALFKQQVGSEDDGTTLTLKEQIMDEFILGNSLEGFHPFEGPIDPAAATMRNNIACRILDPDGDKLAPPLVDSVDLYFKKLLVKDEIQEKLESSFPIKINKFQDERAAGALIFRKRGGEELTHAADEKKIKKEEPMEIEEAQPVADDNDAPIDYDNLLDELD